MLIFFTSKYIPGLIEENNKNKLSKFVSRLGSKLIIEGGSALDVGPGSGFLLDYLIKKKYTYSFIEPIEEFIKNLIRRGGICAARDIYSCNNSLESQIL